METMETVAAVMANMVEVVKMVAADGNDRDSSNCKGNLTILRRILHLDLAKGDPK
jgi:hypothetical protein